MSEEDFVEVVEAACNHPGLYTPTGSFYEIASFLEGYGIGANVDIAGIRTSHSSFTPFLRWLANKFGINDVILSWREYRDRFTSDLEAFEGLRNLYKAYVDSRRVND